MSVDPSLATDLRTISAGLRALARTFADVAHPPASWPEPALVAALVELAWIGAVLADVVEEGGSDGVDGQAATPAAVRQWLDLANLAVALVDPSRDRWRR